MADGGHNNDAMPGSPFHPSNLLPYLLTLVPSKYSDANHISSATFPFVRFVKPPITQSIANDAGHWHSGTWQAGMHPIPTSTAANVDCNAGTSMDPW